MASSATKRVITGHGRGLLDLPPIPASGYCRKAQILKQFPVSSSFWDARVKSGLFPKPVKVGGSNLWKAEDIHKLLEGVGAGQFAGIGGDDDDE